ncbi:MAG: hypothetical protein R3F59_05935, partial [Myxococcota bacterium]
MTPVDWVTVCEDNCQYSSLVAAQVDGQTHLWVDGPLGPQTIIDNDVVVDATNGRFEAAPGLSALTVNGHRAQISGLRVTRPATGSGYEPALVTVNGVDTVLEGLQIVGQTTSNLAGDAGELLEVAGNATLLDPVIRDNLGGVRAIQVYPYATLTVAGGELVDNRYDVGIYATTAQLVLDGVTLSAAGILVTAFGTDVRITDSHLTSEGLVAVGLQSGGSLTMEGGTVASGPSDYAVSAGTVDQVLVAGTWFESRHGWGLTAFDVPLVQVVDAVFLGSDLGAVNLLGDSDLLVDRTWLCDEGPAALFSDGGPVTLEDSVSVGGGGAATGAGSVTVRRSSLLGGAPGLPMLAGAAVVADHTLIAGQGAVTGDLDVVTSAASSAVPGFELVQPVLAPVETGPCGAWAQLAAAEPNR